jgi:hypothetical protein
MYRHIYTILHRSDGAPMGAQVEANNHRQALLRYARGTSRDQRVPANEFSKGFQAIYVCKQNGQMPVTH